MKRSALFRWIPFRLAALVAPLIAAWPQASRAANATWAAGAGTAWYTAANWSPAAAPGLQGVAASNTDIATWTSAATATTFGINMTTASLNLGAISIDSTRALATNVGNNAATAGVLRLYGATVNSVANTIIRNNSAQLLTIQATQTGTMGVVLSNTTNNIVNIDGAGGVTISSIISESVAGNKLTKGGAGTGVLLLSGANTYTGATTVSTGTLRAGNALAFGTIAGGVSITSGAVVDLNGQAIGAEAFALNGTGISSGGALTNSSATAASLSGTINLASNSSVGGAGTGAMTLSGIISGPGTLTKVGTGTTILSSANTYANGTTISAGILQLGNATAAGTAPNITLAASGSGRLFVGGGVTTGYNIDINASQAGAVGQGLVQQTGTGQATMNGTITLAAQPAAGGVFVGGTAVGNELVLNGAVNGGASIGFSQRDGRVNYKGGGSIGGLSPITGTAFIGATNGMPVLTVPILGASAAATLDLGTFSQQLAGITRGGSTATVTGIAGSMLTLDVAGTNSFTYDGAVAGALALVKSGTGTQRLSGTNSFTGGTAVNDGRLLAASTSALGTNSGLTVGATGTFGYQPTAAGALNVGSGAFNFANGSTIGGALGGTASQSAVTSTGAAVTAGSVTVDVWMIPGVAPTAGSNNLFTAGSGLDTASYTLGKVYNPTDFTVSGLAASPTAVSLNVNAATALTTAYWRGGLAGATNVWAASDGSTQSNWVATPGGANQPLAPGAGADVVISDTTVSTSPAPSTLGSNMSIKSLTVNDTTNGLALNADSFSLTTGTGGITVASGVPASSIAAPVALGAAQTWTNNSANPLTVSGVVSGANLLTKDGTGSVVLSAANTNTGGVTINNGTLALGSTTALGTVAGNLTINGGALDSTVASLTMGNAKPTTVNGDFAYTGTGGNALNLSTGVVGLGTSAGTTRTITVNAGTLTLGGIISNGTTANAIAKAGAGTLVLSGVNTHTGLMSVTGGTLQIAAATGLGSGVATNTVALSGGGRLLATATTDLTANRSIAVGSGGGVLAFSNGSPGTLTVPGAITGSDPLTIQNVAAGLGTFALTGNNTGFTGAMSVTALGTAAAVVTLAGQTSLPAAPSITLNYPANATTGGTSNNLSFPVGVNLPATTTLNMTSFQLSPTVSLRSGVTITGASGTSNIDSPIRLGGSSVSQFTAATGTTVNYTGGLAETTPGSYAEAPGVPNSNVVFFRGAGTHNYTTTAINLPSTGARIAVTDGAVLNLNTTGNTFASAASLFGTFRIGATNAVPTTTTLIIGQSADQVATFDLNGFDQTISTLTYAAVTLNTTTRGISNSHASATSTFTVNQAADATFGGTLTGRINFVKGGANSLTLSATNSTFTGNVTVDNGSLIASAGSAGTNGVLGVVNQAGRTVTVNNTGTLSFTSNNIFGNGVGNANLPAVTVNAGGSLTSTRYNVLGPVTLNGGLLTQSSTDTGTFQGYQLRGDVTVGGSVASNISTGNGKGTHLGANTIFTVADVTGSAAADLTISTPLLDQSGDFASAAGGFTKDGPGTMTLSGTNTYTGPTTVNNGTLRLEAGSSIASSSLLTINSGGTLGGTGTTGALAVAAGGTINPGASPGILSTSGITTAGNVNIEIGGLTAGTGSGFHDQINTTGSLTLNGGLLVVSLVNTYVPNQNDFFDIWLNDGGDAILGSGTFTGMPEGFGDSGTWPVPETAAVEDYWSITYLGNTGNDIRLTYVPEPSSTLLAGAAGLLALSRRRRRTV